MYTTVGRLSSYISQGVYTVSGPFHPFGGAVDIIVVEQQDGSFKCTPWYVKFGKFQGVLKRREKIVTVAVDDVEANFHMYLDHKGEAYFLEEEENSVLAIEYHKSEASQDETSKSEASQDETSKSEASQDETSNKNQNQKGGSRSLLGMMFGAREQQQPTDSAPSVVELLENKWSIGNNADVIRDAEKSQPVPSCSEDREVLNSRDFSGAEVVLMSVDGHVVVAKQDDIFRHFTRSSSVLQEDEIRSAKENYVSVNLEVNSSDDEQEDVYVVCKLQSESTITYVQRHQRFLSFENSNLAEHNDCQKSGEDDVFKSCLALPDLLSGTSEDEEEQPSSPKQILEEETITDEERVTSETTTTVIKVPGKGVLEMTDSATSMKVGSESNLAGPRQDFMRLGNSLSSYFLGKEEKKLFSLDVPSRFPPSTGSDVEEAVEKETMDDSQVGNHWSVSNTVAMDELETEESNFAASYADLDLSLCRHLLTEGMGVEAASQVFDTNKVTLEKFKTSSCLVKNEEVVVRVGGRYYSAAVAGSILLGLLAFGQFVMPENEEAIQVEAKALDIVPKVTSDSGSGSGGWKLWPFVSRRPKTAVSREALLVATQTAMHNSLATGLIPKNGYYRRSWKVVPTSAQLASLNLKKGRNKITFTFTTRVLGKQQIDARIYLWKWDAKIVISDVDGTITKSDVLGQVMPLVGRDWTQTGVTRLFSAIKDNGYELMFLSARSISQAYLTRQFLVNLKQDGEALPDGPVVISPDGLFPSLYREVIRRAPHEFKIACLEDIKALFPSDSQPFYAGFGNRDTDEISYLKVGIPKGKIFIINPKGEVIVNNFLDLKSYTSLHKLVNDMFPPVHLAEREDFNSWNFWKIPLPDIDD